MNLDLYTATIIWRYRPTEGRPRWMTYTAALTAESEADALNCAAHSISTEADVDRVYGKARRVAPRTPAFSEPTRRCRFNRFDGWNLDSLTRLRINERRVPWLKDPVSTWRAPGTLA